MTFGNVQGVKVVVHGLNLGSGLDRKAESKEDVLDLALHAHDGVNRARRAAVAGEREVGRNRVRSHQSAECVDCPCDSVCSAQQWFDLELFCKLAKLIELATYDRFQFLRGGFQPMFIKAGENAVLTREPLVAERLCLGFTHRTAELLALGRHRSANFGEELLDTCSIRDAKLFESLTDFFFHRHNLSRRRSFSSIKRWPWDARRQWLVERPGLRP